MRIGFRAVLAAALLAVQATGIVTARFVDTRYLSWAPYDRITQYELDVRLAGRRLDPEEVRHRYWLRAKGRDNRSQAHVMATVRQYETTYGADDGARVTMRYRVNGGPERTWSWPR